MSIKKVALAGATGNLGPSILASLLKAGFSVTVLTRSPSKPVPEGASVAAVDFSDSSSLVAALKGHDAVVSTLPANPTSVQTALVDAAIAAGVRRFVPSEFGSDPSNAKTATLPFYADKVTIEKYLFSKASKGEIEYTLIGNGPFLDWCIMVGLTLNAKGRSVELMDGGDVPFSTTRLSAVGDALANALKLGDATKNRTLLVHDIVTTQKELLEIGKQLTPGEEWTVTHASTEEGEKQARAKVEKGEFDQGVAIACIKRAIWGEGYGGKYEKTDNEELDIPLLSKEGLVDVVKQYI